jgi:mitochondrial fission protein ELM1
MTEKPLNIAAFFDGRPGHEKQTRGVMTALAKLAPLTIREHRLSEFSLASALNNWCRYLAACLRRQKGLRERRVDLIIGTGSHTHLPMLLYQKKSGARTVACMTPSFPFNRLIDLCLVPAHDGNRMAKNLFVTVGPPVNIAKSSRHDSRKGLVMVGGIDRKRHNWRSAVTVGQIEAVIRSADTLQWTISSSPRTPPDTIGLLARLAEKYPQVRFFASTDTPVGWIENAYAKNLFVWVTADSISMVYEALTAGCRVGLLPVDFKHKQDKFYRSMKYLIDNKLCISFKMWQNGIPMPVGRPLDEASRCAREILRRFWPKRLG